MADLTIVVNPSDLARLVGKLGRATSLAMLRVPMTQALALLQTDLATYPNAQPHRQPFKSERQRRFVMAMIRAGKIPYRRTGNLGRSWTSEIASSSEALTGQVGNTRSYGPFVQGADRQSAYFQGSNWPTDKSVFDKRLPKVNDIFKSAVDGALEGT